MSDDLRPGAPDSDWKPLDEWLVLFCDAPARGARRFLRPGFRHVRAISFDPKYRHWVLFDPATGWLMVRPISGETVERLLAWSDRTGGAKLKVRPKYRRARWSMPGCAGAVADLLGLCALTPYGLYRRLRRSGAQELSRGIQTQGQEGQERRSAATS